MCLWCPLLFFCHITMCAVCCSCRLQLLYEMWFCKMKGNTVRWGLVDLAARRGLKAELKVAKRRKHIVSSNNTRLSFALCCLVGTKTRSTPPPSPSLGYASACAYLYVIECTAMYLVYAVLSLITRLCSRAIGTIDMLSCAWKLTQEL